MLEYNVIWTWVFQDICRCCVFYSDRMANRVGSVGNVSTVYEERFEVTTDWCVAINNIDHVRQRQVAITTDSLFNLIELFIFNKNTNIKIKFRIVNKFFMS